VEISAIDWNGDGRLDLILGGSSTFRYFERTPQGTFGLREKIGDENPFRGVEASLLPYFAVGDWNSDGVLDLIVNDNNPDENGKLKLFQQGFCEVQQSCANRGYCNPRYGTCDCLRGHTSSDCSVCASGFASSELAQQVYRPSSGQFRACSACPGMMEKGTACSRRGICRDDFWARRLPPDTQVVPVNLSAQHGDGSCLCNPPFHGETCQVGRCSVGFEYIEHASGDLAACQPCKAGYYKDEEGNGPCTPCDYNMYAASSGQTYCVPCKNTWWRMQPNSEGTGCVFDPLTWVVVPVMLLLSTALFTTLPLLLSLAVKIQDVRREEGGVVITTRCTHFLLRSTHGIRAVFCGTGHPLLDGADKRRAYRVQVRSETELLLISAKSREPIGSEIDSSMGSVQFNRFDGLMKRGLLGIPFVCWAVLLLMGMCGVRSVILLTGAGAGGAQLTALEMLQVIFGLLFAILIHLLNHHRHASGVLDKNLHIFSEELFKKNPHPQPCARGHARAISARQMLDFFQAFQEYIGSSRNMYYVCSNILLPLTKSYKLSYAELAGPKTLEWFCSHFWGTPFAHFVETVTKHAQVVAEELNIQDFAAATYWICTFSNNQWRVAEEVGASWEASSFYYALRSGFCRGTAMILDEDIKPLTRSWCLFELLQTTLLSQEQEQRGESTFKGLLLCTPTGVMNYGQGNIELAVNISKKLATLRLQDASASVQADKDMIDRLVCEQAGGFSEVNKYLIQAVSSALQATSKRFQKDLTQLQDNLTSQITHGQPTPLSSTQLDGMTVTFDMTGQHLQEGEYVMSSAGSSHSSSHNSSHSSSPSPSSSCIDEMA